MPAPKCQVTSLCLPPFQKANADEGLISGESFVAANLQEEIMNVATLYFWCCGLPTSVSSLSAFEETESH